MIRDVDRINTRSQELLEFFERLDTSAQTMLLEFAEFLDNKHGKIKSPVRSNEESLQVPEKPLTIERPPEESVIKAIKRLSKTYPMVDKSELLSKTSALMTQHILKGREASSVIDELEELFLNEYNNL